MDSAKQLAIEACGTCGRPEREHQAAAGEGEQLDILAALGQPVGAACAHFTVSDAAVIYQKYLAISGNRAPQRQPGRVGKRVPFCRRCGQRHRGECVL
jgi:hypothetical protein